MNPISMAVSPLDAMQPFNDALAWFDRNTFMFYFTICFCVGAYAFIKYMTRQKGKETE